MDVGANGPDLGAGDETEGFGVEGAGATEGFLEEAGEEEFCFRGPLRFEMWGGHGAEFCGDGEEAVEGAVGEGGCHFGGDLR